MNSDNTRKSCLWKTKTKSKWLNSCYLSFYFHCIFNWWQFVTNTIAMSKYIITCLYPTETGIPGQIAYLDGCWSWYWWIMIIIIMQIFVTRRHFHPEDAQARRSQGWTSEISVPAFLNIPSMRCVFSLLMKKSTDSDRWIDLGSLFHKWGAADANARSPPMSV